MRILIIICIITTAVAGCSPKPQMIRPALSDRYQVAEAALHHMMDEYSFADARDYSAYAIDGGDLTSQLVAAFANYKPKVIGNIQIKIWPNGVATDKATGKRVELWKVENVAIQGNRATANVLAYQSSLGAEYYTVHLQRKDGKWVVESETLDAVS
jgi:hypothetical protein